MIVDDLFARSAGLRALCRDAHVIRVPFPVYPFDHSVGRLKWVRDRAPRNLIRPDAVRAPFPTVILVSEHAERGFQIVRSVQGEDGTERFTSLLVGRSVDERVLDVDIATSARSVTGLTAIEGFASAWAWLSHHSSKDWVSTWQAPQPCPTRADVNALYAQYLGVRAALLTTVNGRLPCPSYFASPDQLSDEEITERLEEWAGASIHFSFTAACAFSLLNCRNVVLVPRTHSAELQRARIRRGQLPLVASSEILVRAFASKGTRHVGLHGDELQAVHWVRGHVKEYTAEKPLFGNPKNVGAFWWQPHLAGQDTRRRIDSTYRIGIPADAVQGVPA